MGFLSAIATLESLIKEIKTSPPKKKKKKKKHRSVSSYHPVFTLGSFAVPNYVLLDRSTCVLTDLWSLGRDVILYQCIHENLF
jgi:hypothetical protein